MNMHELLYILENQVPVPTDNLLQWGQWMENLDNKQVASTEIDELRVSTVFLGVNNQFNEGQPFLFESLVFKGEQLDWEYDGARYRTWEEAKAGHDAIVELIKAQKIDEQKHN